MTTINRSALVMHSAEQMYTLVNEVEHYADFLPWCRSSKVLSRDDASQRATVEIAKGPLNKSFTTSNTMLSGRRITIVLEDGPFSQLNGQWLFEPLGDKGCRVTLDIEFEFSSRLIGLVLTPIFSDICSTMVEAFVQRANAVYKI